MNDILNNLGTVGGQVNHQYAIGRRAAAITFKTIAVT